MSVAGRGVESSTLDRCRGGGGSASGPSTTHCLDARRLARPLAAERPIRPDRHVRRLNRTNTECHPDLLGLDIDATALLPADESARFDNVTVGDLSRDWTATSPRHRRSVAWHGKIGPIARRRDVPDPSDITQEEHVEGCRSDRGGR